MVADPPCIHHWEVQSPDGSLQLQARCRKCSKQRTFPANPEPVQFDWRTERIVDPLDKRWEVK